VFEANTKEKAGKSRRILIIDSHNSHLNLAFIDFCDHHRIIPIFLLSHSTHRLQPLDVGLFSPLANYYTQEIDRLITEGQGLVSISKRYFWKFFRAAWDKAFSEENITEAFAATGIWPCDPERVIKKLKRT
jgi:DDE superfamily endonuclease